MRRIRLLAPLLLLLCTGKPQPLAASPRGEGIIEVRGRLIDIRQAQPGAEVFPQYKRNRFGKSLPARLEGMTYAVSLREFRGPEAVRASKPCDLLLALSGARPDTTQWLPTGEGFFVDKTRYRLYRRSYDTPGRWLELPSQQEGPSCMLFAENLRVAGTAPVPGVVIAQVRELRRTHITNPNLLILPDGSYLAACSGANLQQNVDFYRSTDRGATWKHWSRGRYPINFYTVFLHQGALYMMGTATPQGDIIICRSDDMGRTWSFPDETRSDEGILRRGKYHSAPVPVVVHGGRIWRAMETNTPGEQRRAFVMSAPVGADLMQASSWRLSEQLDYDPAWIDGNRFRQWIEGNIVVAPDQSLVNVLRVDEHTCGRSAAIVRVLSPERLAFDPRRDIVEMPGGGKKFTIRYDSLSQRYWSLTSVVCEKFRGLAHGGIYANGIHCGLIRNTLALISSEDLRRWDVERIVIRSDNPFFDGFQYIDWQFDGDDLIAVIRLAVEEPRGLPNRQHDANFLVFKRIERFREPGAAVPDNVRTLHKP